jgi:hypothetical protein
MLPFKALLVEGTSGVGKSTLIDTLIRRQVGSRKPRKIRTLVHLAQSHTYGPLAQLEDRGLTAAANLLHLERIVSHLEWLHASVQEHDRPWCFVLIDTLHLTHCVRPGVVKWGDVERFDSRLAELGCKLCFLRVSPVAIWERGITPRQNEQFIQSTLKNSAARSKKFTNISCASRRCLPNCIRDPACRSCSCKTMDCLTTRQTRLGVFGRKKSRPANPWRRELAEDDYRGTCRSLGTWRNPLRFISPPRSRPSGLYLLEQASGARGVAEIRRRHQYIRSVLRQARSLQRNDHVCVLFPHSRTDGALASLQLGGISG